MRTILISSSRLEKMTTRRQRHEAAMYELGRVAGQVRESDYGVTIYAEMDSRTRMCELKAKRIFSLQGKLDDDELDLILKKVNEAFLQSNDYVSRVLKTRYAFMIAGYFTCFTSYLVYLPVWIHKSHKLERLLCEAYAQANEVCEALNQKLLKSRGIKATVQREGHGVQGIQLPVLHFEFRRNSSNGGGELAATVVKSENIPVAAVCAQKTMI